MFFTADRPQFFRPLTGKYREQVVQCLCLLYQRLYSANADYGHSLSREQVIEILEEALARAPVLEADDEADEQTRFKNLREQANWILKQLLEAGWLERQVDPATMQSAYPFSRMGRLLTQPLVESSVAPVRTRHRNTRNTLNALEAFLNRKEVHDLLDAFEYSERIVTDFTDVISELEERKRELVREVESQQLVQNATDQFFEFMEKRFQPDVSVRLSADSVEKHRDQIQKTLAKIRRKPSEQKREVELQLRRMVPELVVDNSQSVLYFILDTIERRMSNAAEIMLPALRRALHGFTKRADIIIRQLTYLNAQQDNLLTTLCSRLQVLPNDQYQQLMQQAGDRLSSVKLQLIDPASIKLYERKKAARVQTAVAEVQAFDQEARRELFIQQLLDQAFAMTQSHVREYVLKALRGGQRISTRSLPVDTAQDLLAAAHVIEVGSANQTSSEYYFDVQPVNSSGECGNEYFHKTDEFFIELKQISHD